MKKKIFSLLVLLVAAVSGAWAEEVTIGDPTSTSTDSYLPGYSLYEYSLTQQIYTADEIGMSGTITTLTMWLRNNSSYARNINVYMKEVSGSIFEVNNSWVSLSADDLVGTATINNGVFDPTETTLTLETPFEYSGTGNLLICIHDITGTWSSGMGGVVFETESNQSLYAYRDGTAYDISNPGVNGTLINKKNVVRLDIEESGLEVTTNAEEGETTFTEATFNMPAFDATAEYELVRDMEYKVNAYVGDNADATYRHRVELVGNNIYKPKGITNNAQITALFNVVDNIDAENPKTLVYGTDFTVAIVDKDENEINPAEFNFAPGTYTIKVTGKGDYDGVIDSQNAFKLYLGVDITVPAGELVTYYSDETLYTEEEYAVIYTITDVSGTEATATELTIVPANTPFLVKNTADERKTFLFIVTDGDQQLVANYYPGFTGTLNATTIDASTADQTNYAFNGKEFVYVKNAIEVAANKAWLNVNTVVPSARITIVFSDATGVESVELRTENGEFATAAWYDLNGRKLQGMPTKKGVYIMNGRKVVIR